MTLTDEQLRASIERLRIETDAYRPQAPFTRCQTDDLNNLLSAFDAARARLREMEGALRVPDVWSQIERDGMAEAFRLAAGKHGHYEALFAVAAWLLRHRRALSQPAESGARALMSEKCVRFSDGVALLTEAFNALGNLLFDKPGAQDLTLHDRIGEFLHARIEEHRPIREEVMRLMREDFDPTPPNWEGRDWDDNAEDVADKIMALLSQPAKSGAKPTAGERLINAAKEMRARIAKEIGE